MVEIKGFVRGGVKVPDHIPPIDHLKSIRLPSTRQGFRRPFRKQGGERPDTLLLNVVTSETHTLGNNLTRAPVDGEADRAQHIIAEPIRLSITAIVSAGSDSMVDSPVAVFADAPETLVSFEAGGTVSDRRIPTNVSQTLRNAAQQSRIITIRNKSAYQAYTTFWARLKALNNDRVPFEYISDLQVYQDMVFVSIEVTRSSAEWIEFTAELEEFRTVGVTRDRWLADDQLDASRDGADAGTKTTQAIDESSLPSDNPFSLGTLGVTGVAA
jgi:hypothetical protein